MQGHFHPHPHLHLHQHLAALLSAADPSAAAAATSSPSPAPDEAAERSDDAVRVAALDSLQRAFIYPSNALLLPHSAPFLFQGLSRLLSDKSYAVRRAAAVTYGTLCAVLSSTALGSNGVPNLVLTYGDQFITWALPLLRDIGIMSGSAELALEGIWQFLNIGDASSIERFVPPILKALQELLENDRTSWTLLRQLLGVITSISLKFDLCFQPHFVDVVDLLLGWAFMPDLSESDRVRIMDTFLQFQKHWLNNIQFLLGLLFKFLGDIEVLIHDVSTETGSQFARLLALFSCFSTVLQVLASGMIEISPIADTRETLENMAPRLIRCIATFHSKFGLTKWTEEPRKCLIPLAEILQESFSASYQMAVDIFFQILPETPSSQVNAMVKINLQLLSLQKLGLLPSSVQSLLRSGSPLSLLRLHPNCTVVASAAATYLFLLQHESNAVVSQAITSLCEEMQLLKEKLCGRFNILGDLQLDIVTGFEVISDSVSGNMLSELELISLIKFDLNLLLHSVFVDTSNSDAGLFVTDTLRHERSVRISSFILEVLNPFESPLSSYLEIQLLVIRALHKLSDVEFSYKFSMLKSFSNNVSGTSDMQDHGGGESMSNEIAKYLSKYSEHIIRALNASSPVTVILEALDWIHMYCMKVIALGNDENLIVLAPEPHADVWIDIKLLLAICDASYAIESRVRFHVASVFEVLFQARLIDPAYLYTVSEVSLDKFGDPDASVRNAFTRVLSIVLPITVYSCGMIEDGGSSFRFLHSNTVDKFYFNWKKTLALKQFPRKLRSHQLVSVISYISQRWKVPLSTWIQRLVFSCRGKREFLSSKPEVTSEACASGMWKDNKAQDELLDKICSVNNIAAVWWSIHEAARHCIALRLRTNLGGPTQTFSALERMLLDIPNVLLLDVEQGDSKYLASSSAHFLPMHLSLDFVEALKKYVYNAYEGSFILPCSPKQSSLFFRANKKVCEEWFSRICEPMMNAAVALHSYDATIQYCALRLQDLKNLAVSAFKDKGPGATTADNLNFKDKLAGDTLKVIQHASLAMCRNNEPEALFGLQRWAAANFSVLFPEEKQLDTDVFGNFGHFSWMTGLVYQARGQYERAAAYFSHLLQSEAALTLMGSDGVQFVIARVIECYTSVSDWKSLENWLAELQALRAMHAGKGYSGALTTAGKELNAVHSLARYDDGDFQAAWAYLDLTHKSSCEITLDPKIALERSEQMLLRSMLQRDAAANMVGEDLEKSREDIDKAKVMLEEALSAMPLDGLSKASAYFFQLHCIFAFEEGTKSIQCDKSKGFPSYFGPLHQALRFPGSMIIQDCSLWTKVLRIYRAVLPTSLATLLLSHKLLAMARKQNNFLLADRMVEYLESCPVKSPEGIHADLNLNLQYQRILLKFAKGRHEDALTDVWSFLNGNVLSKSSTSSGSNNVIMAKTCLKLSSWLTRGTSDLNKYILFKIRDDLITSFSPTPTTAEMSDDSGLTSDANFPQILQEIVGTTRKLSCQLCPNMGKAWLSYASWCFDQAKGAAESTCLQSCSLSPVLLSEFSPNRYKLTKSEMLKIETIVKKIYYNEIGSNVDGNHSDPRVSELASFVNSMVQRVAHIMEAAAGAPGFESCDDGCPSAALYSQLKILLLHSKVGTEENDVHSIVSELVDIWWSLRKRRVLLFGHAARGYFEYLACSSKFVSSMDYGCKEKLRSSTLRAMLYVLHITVNYGYELAETLECGFSTVPAYPWQEIIPQLFARLSSHPNQVVRRHLEGLLMMVAKLCPWPVVYPILVDLDASEGHPSEELQRILDFLIKLYPKLIQDVKLVIDDLGTITVLWEELWLSTLQDLHPDVMRRINMLKDEVARTAENSTLSDNEKSKINAAKYSAMMAPVAVALERRLASTSREPKTTYELWFHKEYLEQLKLAILRFKTPPKSVAALGDVWRPFDSIAASLAAHHRRSYISLSEVAPRLANLSTSEVPMPGFEKQILAVDSPGKSTSEIQGIVTISSFFEQVMILSTKTKPKKLILKGSDGQNYTYLLKGREDLRLDARIMQLLQSINSLLFSCNDSRSKSLAIRYYSVTPISGRAGLIQWVDNVTSIYSIYKSWQIRTQMAQVSAADAGNSTLPPIPRPSDMFYGKIIPALKEKGIRRVISRKDWPLEVKKKVFVELMNETPKQLLWQEMWCASESFKAFSTKTKRFSASVAAMSIVGHVLGLGDRHLDNILMDFFTGEVLHIDYNVCFDKGRRLKIPEIVPFRLTQIIETALGLTGIEGIFRANCEAVLGVLQKHKDIILMLLEVFIWNPLVEWTRGESHDEAVIGGEEKKGMELAVSLSLFASRVQEIRVPLQEHHDLFVVSLPAVESALKAFLDVLNEYEVTSTAFYHAEKERSILVQREMSAKSMIAEVTSISEKARASFEAFAHDFAQAKALGAEKSQEAAVWVDEHGRVLDAIRSGSIPDIKTSLRLSSKTEVLSLISAVVVSGVPLTIVPEPTQAQCYDLDREISNLISELESGLSCATESLHEYALALQRVLPVNYVTTSPLSGWAQVIQFSVNNLSSETLLLARQQAAELIAKNKSESFDSIQKRHQDLLHKTNLYSTEIQKLAGECSELISSIGQDTEVKSKELLLSAFTKYMQFVDHSGNDDDCIPLSGHGKYDGKKEAKMHTDFVEKKSRVIAVLSLAVTEEHKNIKEKIVNITSDSPTEFGWRIPDNSPAEHVSSFIQFEEHIEKCAVLATLFTEVQQLVGSGLPSNRLTAEDLNNGPERNWASVFQVTLHGLKQLIEQLTEKLLPDIVRLAVSYDSEVMEAFGSLSQIRGSIDTALEKLIEVELERASLMELESNYFVKVGLITEQQFALGEAAKNGRDHLSWEEAEELASQEEACRAQLDQLHETWNQKDARSSSLLKLEANLRSSLTASRQYFKSLTTIEEESNLHVRRSKVLLAALSRPFLELESVEEKLQSLDTVISNSFVEKPFNLADFVASSSSLSESIWSFPQLSKDNAFFIWKVSILDSVLDMCLHEISYSVDHDVDIVQLYTSLKKKLELHLQKLIGRYLKGRVGPAFLVHLDKENEKLQTMVETRRKFTPDQLTSDAGAVRRVQLMLEEYCNAHETARAAKAAVSQMRRQINELTEIVGKTTLELVRMEWLHDLSFPYPLKTKVLSPDILGNDKFFTLALNLSRPKLLENLQTSLSLIARSLESLQVCQKNSAPAEGQLERAMGWACAGSSHAGGLSTSSVKSSGIPSEFHDHLLRRKQFLWTCQEQATDVTKILTSIVEFEASRDGIFLTPGDKSSIRTTADRIMWQQTFVNILTRLDVAYHSFTRSEQEWKLAESKMEASANNLFAATNEQQIASVKAKSAAGNLQKILAAMRDRACEATVSLSSFSRVSKGHIALTSESGSMLEEVLAITEGLDDIYSLAKEATACHSRLMADLSKANMILLPLEASLSDDLAAMTDVLKKEAEGNKDIAPIHGQALYQSCIFKVREACKSLVSLVPSLTDSVKELHSMLTKLARNSSIHAGNLHKALEGLGESQVLRSQDTAISRPESSQAVEMLVKDKDSLRNSEGSGEDSTPVEFSFGDEGWISPPEHSYTSGSDSYIMSNMSEESDKLEQQDIIFSSCDTTENQAAKGLESQNLGEETETRNTVASTLPSGICESMQALSLPANEASVNNGGCLYDIKGEDLDKTKASSSLNEDQSLKMLHQHSENPDCPSKLDSNNRIARGKNAYALAVLKQVELKIDGGSTENPRFFNVPEQVDYLLQQATSIDNLCNMYEGWTPWI